LGNSAQFRAYFALIESIKSGEFTRNQRTILSAADCLAEREGFELPAFPKLLISGSIASNTHEYRGFFAFLPFRFFRPVCPVEPISAFYGQDGQEPTGLPECCLNKVWLEGNFSQIHESRVS
jgi:hypothetical protein